MKKISKTHKLALNTETIRQLGDTELKQAAGGYLTAYTCLNCQSADHCTVGTYCPSGLTACLCISQNRTNCC